MAAGLDLPLLPPPEEAQHRRDPADRCALVLHCCALSLAENGGQECCMHLFWGEYHADPAGGG